MAGTPLSNRWASQFTHLVSRHPRTIWNWRWESTSSYCSENAWRATADVLPETFQHRFLCEKYLRRLPNHIKDADPDIPILKEAKAEYAKLQ